MDETLPLVSGKKTSGGGFLETLLQWVASDSGIKVILVVGALIVLFLFVKWVMTRSSTLFEEHDQLRKSLAEDRELLRDEVRELLARIEVYREKLLDKEAIIQGLHCKELTYRQKLMEMGFDLAQLEEPDDE